MGIISTSFLGENEKIPELPPTRKAYESNCGCLELSSGIWY